MKRFGKCDEHDGIPSEQSIEPLVPVEKAHDAVVQHQPGRRILARIGSPGMNKSAKCMRPPCRQSALVD
jgi:hypothetical protein